MPRTAWPPTPSSSTDIHGKDGTKHLSSLQVTFELPGPAMDHPNSAQPTSSDNTSSDNNMNSPVSPVSTTSPKTPYRVQPSEAVKSRRRSSAAAGASAREGSSFALPPPPTRSRKIIQMKPRPQEEKKKRAAPEPAATTSGKGAGKRAATAAPAPAAGEAGASTKKQPSTTSVAGRKIARKTAHSLIERRRRSKMNEEFAVLKNMIPACTGEMHKLAILQASIEYVRYLQDCVEKLNARRDRQTPSETEGRESHNPEQQHHYEHSYPQEQHSPDVEMTGSAIAPSPTFTTRPSSSTPLANAPSISPALTARDSWSNRRYDSYSSTSTAGAAAEQHRHHSATTSPAIGPGWGFGQPPSNHSASGSTLTSPALGPLRERDLDQEATAALLMLNSDRRGTVGRLSGGTNAGGGGGWGGPGRGMSVRDLLSA